VVENRERIAHTHNPWPTCSAFDARSDGGKYATASGPMIRVAGEEIRDGRGGGRGRVFDMEFAKV